MLKKTGILVLVVATCAVLWAGVNLLGLASPRSIQVLYRGIERTFEDARLSGKVDRYLLAVRQKNESLALALWAVTETGGPGAKNQAKLSGRRAAMTHELVAARMGPNFDIKSIELWRPACCESGSGLSNDYRWAAGARVQIDLDINGAWESYVFDLFGDGRIVEPGQWLIRDVYRLSDEPLYWRTRSHVLYDAFP